MVVGGGGGGGGGSQCSVREFKDLCFSAVSVTLQMKKNQPSHMIVEVKFSHLALGCNKLVSS